MTVTEATAAHEAAKARHQAALQAATAASQQHAALLAQREAMSRAAVIGETVDQTARQALRAKITDAAEDATDAAKAAELAAGAVHTAFIDLRQAEATALDQAVVDLAAELLDAGRQVDSAIEAARIAVARMNDLAARHAEAKRSAWLHNEALTADARSNPVMATAHPSTWPKTRLGAAGTAPKALRAELVITDHGQRFGATGPHDAVLLRGAEDHARQAAGPAAVAVAA